MAYVQPGVKPVSVMVVDASGNGTAVRDVHVKPATVVPEVVASTSLLLAPTVVNVSNTWPEPAVLSHVRSATLATV